MQFAYEPYVLWRRANGRILFVNANMPFEYFINCFQTEQPFFLISRLDDGRIAITPNAFCIPSSLHETGFWPQHLLPAGYEYVTMKHGTYPVLVSAHAVTDFEDWYRAFEMCVDSFAKQTLMEFIASSYEYLPVKVEAKFTKKESVPV